MPTPPPLAAALDPPPVRTRAAEVGGFPALFLDNAWALAELALVLTTKRSWPWPFERLESELSAPALRLEALLL